MHERTFQLDTRVDPPDGNEKQTLEIEEDDLSRCETPNDLLHHIKFDQVLRVFNLHRRQCANSAGRPRPTDLTREAILDDKGYIDSLMNYWESTLKAKMTPRTASRLEPLVKKTYSAAVEHNRLLLQAGATLRKLFQVINPV